MLFGVTWFMFEKTSKIRKFPETSFHIFIENFSFSARKICVHPQFSTEFELKGTIFENKYVLVVFEYSEFDSYEGSNSILSAKDK